MKKILLPILLICVLAGIGAGCGPKKPTLNVYTWSDYISEDLVERFEKENGCRVRLSFFDSNESMYAKIKAGATGYDVIFPSSYMVAIMNEQGMLSKLNHDLLPNIKNVDPVYLNMAFDKKMEHSVPYMITVACIAAIPEAGEVEASWTQFAREDLKGRMTLLDDMRETIGAALKTLGYSLNTLNDKQLMEAKDLVVTWKRNIATFENEQYKNGLASGEYRLVHGYSGDLLQVKEDREDIKILVPKEGSSISFDDMVIPVDAKQPELAHKFINFLYEPDVSAENTEFVFYLCPNAASYELLSEEIRANPILFPPEDVVKKLEMIADLGVNNVKYSMLWDAIKAAN